MIYVAYSSGIISLWSEHPNSDDIYYNKGDALLDYYKQKDPSFEAWMEFFFPKSKYPALYDGIVRTVTEQTFDEFILGKYDKVKKVMRRVIAVVFENSRMSSDWGSKEYTYYCDDPAVSVGDIIDSPNYNNRVKVVKIGTSSKTDLREMPIGKVYKENEEVIELLRRCSQDPKIVLCLWSICKDSYEELKKVQYCESFGIHIDYINVSPHVLSDGKKQFFNALLDDRAGLESAYNNLKYVLDNA